MQRRVAESSIPDLSGSLLHISPGREQPYLPLFKHECGASLSQRWFLSKVAEAAVFGQTGIL